MLFDLLKVAFQKSLKPVVVPFYYLCYEKKALFPIWRDIRPHLRMKNGLHSKFMSQIIKNCGSSLASKMQLRIWSQDFQEQAGPRPEIEDKN